MAAIWTTYYLIYKESYLSFHHYWLLHLLLGVGTVFAGFTCIYLSLHWPRGELSQHSLLSTEPAVVLLYWTGWTCIYESG